MRKVLMATSALALAGAMAAGPASAADMMSVGVGGYMQQWFGYANRDDDGAEGGWAVHSDSEIFFKGSLESDMGLKYTVHVELEGDGGATAMDESYARVSGEFGQLEFGARDHAMVRMHAGISDVGVGLTSGDTQAWIPGTYLETAGHAGTAGGGNDPKLNYISPRVSGLQVGVSYAPEDGSARTTSPSGNDAATWGAGLNFQQAVADGNFTFSLGHRSVESAGATFDIMSGTNDDTITAAELTAAKKAIADYTEGRDLTPGATILADQSSSIDSTWKDAADATNNIAAATDDTVTKSDNATYTNVGVGVGFGAFKFNVAYATSDGGAYMAVANNIVVTGGADYYFDHDSDGCGVATDKAASDPSCKAVDGTATAGKLETADLNDPDNDTARTSVVKDKSKDFDVWGVSVTYTDGPMALSLGYMTHEEDAGGERTATMLSASYTLAPGVAWKSSVFGVEDTTNDANVAGGINEGTGFVTGITLNF